MAIKDYITDTLEATHCLSFDNTGEEIPNTGSASPTKISWWNYFFEDKPVAYWVSYSLATNNKDWDDESRENWATLERKKDINDWSDWDDSTSYDWKYKERTLLLWARQKTYETTSVIYEQGAQVNNHAFFWWIWQTLTYQAADDWRPFLIAQAQFLPQDERNYLLTGIWQHYDYNPDWDNNRILFYVNWVLQQIAERVTNQDWFPSHSWDINVWNTDDDLKSYNEWVMKSAIRQSNVNWLTMINNKSLTEEEIREFFERTVIPEYVLEGTLEEIQEQLDNFKWSEFKDINCVFEIRQPSDVDWDFRLFVDNINFIQHKWTRDIAIQYVWPNKLILENCNWANTEEVSTPPEKDLDWWTTIIQGWWTIEVLNKRIRYFDNAEIVNSQNDKLVIEWWDTYTLNGWTITEIENVSWNDVVVYLKNWAPIPTLIETSWTITIVNNMYIQFKNITENASLYVQDDTWNKFVYEVDLSWDYLLTIPREYHWKTFKAVVKKPWYNHQLSEFTVNEWAYVEINVNLTKRLNADWTDMYLWTTTDLVDIEFDDINQANILIWDWYAPLQATFDETEIALTTEAGMKWLINIWSVCSQFNSAGWDYLFMWTKWRLKRRDSWDGNATLNAFAMSADWQPVDDSNWDVKFLTSDTPTAIAKAVWSAIISEHITTWSFWEKIQNLDTSKLDVAVSSRLASNDTRLNNLDATISSRKPDVVDFTDNDRNKLNSLESTIPANVDTLITEKHWEWLYNQRINWIGGMQDAKLASLIKELKKDIQKELENMWKTIEDDYRIDYLEDKINEIISSNNKIAKKLLNKKTSKKERKDIISEILQESILEDILQDSLIEDILK